MRDFDQLKRRLMHCLFEFPVSLPVTVGFLYNNTPLEKETLQHLLDIKRLTLGIAHTKRHIFKIKKKCHILGFKFNWHYPSCFNIFLNLIIINIYEFISHQSW